MKQLLMIVALLSLPALCNAQVSNPDSTEQKISVMEVISQVKDGDFSNLVSSNFNSPSESAVELAKAIPTIPKERIRRQVIDFCVGLEKKDLAAKGASLRSSNSELVNALLDILINDMSDSVACVAAERLMESFEPSLLDSHKDSVRNSALQRKDKELFLLYCSLPSIELKDVTELTAKLERLDQRIVDRALARHGDAKAEKRLLDMAEEAVKSGDKVRTSFEALSYAASKGIMVYLAEGLRSGKSVELPGGEVRPKMLISAETLIKIEQVKESFPFKRVEIIRSESDFVQLEE